MNQRIDLEKCIVVNATALDRSGALTILRQFVNNIPTDKTKWILFTPEGTDIICANPNVRIVPISNVKAVYKRLLWDSFGLKKWLKKHGIKASAAVSLQNTGFKSGCNVPTFIYYHQPLPFYPYSWNPLKKRERIFWLYKWIYPYFVKIFLNENTQIFVQLDFVKKGFSEHFNHPRKNIGVYSPSVMKPVTVGEFENHKTKNLRLFYPAMGYFYKNHRVISEALKTIDLELDVYFTIEKQLSANEDSRIRYIGTQPYEKVCEMYHVCDALIFPSYIETFGLPLLEAAMTGMPIIAADLPYAREVLSGYDGAVFVKHDKPLEWASAIKELKKGVRYKPINISSRPGWKELFETIKKSF